MSGDVVAVIFAALYAVAYFSGYARGRVRVDCERQARRYRGAKSPKGAYGK